jgi:hypothetical protein
MPVSSVAPCACAKSPVSSDATAGSIDGAVVNAALQRTPWRATWSRNGVVSRP